MKYLILVLPLLLLGCPEETRSTGKYEGVSVRASRIFGDSLSRFENREVICYAYDNYNGGGLSCKWKGDQP